MAKAKKVESITAEEFDEKFEAGEDIEKYLKPQEKDTWRLIVDFPKWMADDLRHAADTLGINNQALVKTWLADRLKQEKLDKLKVG